MVRNHLPFVRYMFIVKIFFSPPSCLLCDEDTDAVGAIWYILSGVHFMNIGNCIANQNGTPGLTILCRVLVKGKEHVLPSLAYLSHLTAGFLNEYNFILSYYVP